MGGPERAPHPPQRSERLGEAATLLDVRDIRQRAERRGEARASPDSSTQVSTVIGADSVTEKPLSPVQWNVRVPLSVATVEKAMNGFAAIAGWSSALKTSVPL